MKTIVLISCVSKKLAHAARARDIYVSPLFRLNLAYAESLKPDAIYVLSAKHGLLALEDQIETVPDEFLKKGFQMAIDGNTADVRVVPQGRTDDVLQSCMTQKASAWTFPALATPQTIEVPYKLGTS